MATTYVTTATTLTITGGTITLDDIVTNTLASEFGLFSEAGGQVYLSFLDIVLHNVTLTSNNATIVFRSLTANPRIRLTGTSSWTDGAVNTAGGTFGGSTLVFNADEIDDTAWHFINDATTNANLNGTTFKFVGTRTSANPILLHFTNSTTTTRFRNVTIDASGITNTTHNVRVFLNIIRPVTMDIHTIGLVDVRQDLGTSTVNTAFNSLSYSRPNSNAVDFTATDALDTILRNLTVNAEDGVVIHVPDNTELTLLNPNIASDDIRVINTSATGIVNIAEDIITQVIDRDNGNPVAGAIVRYQDTMGDQVGTQGTSDTEGDTPSQRLRVFRGSGTGIATAQPITAVADTYIRARVRAYHYLDTQDLLYDVGLRHIQATMVRDEAVTLTQMEAAGFVGLTYDGTNDVFNLSVQVTISELYSLMKLQHAGVYNDENTTNTLSFVDNLLDLGGYGLTLAGGARILANNVEEAINYRGHTFGVNDHRTISSRVAPYVYSDTVATIRVWKDDQPAGNHSYRVSYVDMNTTNTVVLHDVGEMADTQHGTGFEFNNFIYPRGSVVTVRWMGIRGLPIHETANNVTEELIHEVITTPQQQGIVMPTTITGRVSLNNYADALEARVGATWSFDNATRTLTIDGDTNVRVHEIVAYLQRYHYENLHHSDTYVLQYDGTNADLGDITLAIDTATIINDIGKIIIVHDFTIPNNAQLQNVLIRNTDGILSQFIFDQDSVRASVIGYSYGATGGFTELFREDQVPNHYQLFHDHEGLAGVYVYALDHEPQFQLVNINSTHREYFPSRRLPYTSNMTELTNILDDILNNRIVLTRTDTPDSGSTRQLASLTVTFNYPTDETFSLNRFSALMAILWQREEFFSVELQRQTGQTIVIAENEIIIEQFQPRLIAGVRYGDLGTIFFRLADGANDIAFDFGVSSTYNWRPANATGNQISFRGDIFAGGLNITSNLSEFEWSIADTTDINNVTHYNQNQILITINSSTTYRIVGTSQGHAPILTEFNSDTCDTVHLNFIRNDRDYLATDITAVGNVGTTFRVAGAGFALDVVITVNDLTGFEWDIGRFKAFWNQFSRLNQVRQAMLVWNTVELVQLTADGIFVDRPHRVQFELADGIDQDFILAFRAGFLDPAINWNRDNAEGHRIRTNLTVVDITVDNQEEVGYTYNVDGGDVFTSGSIATMPNTDVGHIRLILPHGHVYKFVITATGYVPYVVTPADEPITISLSDSSYIPDTVSEDYLDRQVNDGNLTFARDGVFFVIGIRGRYTRQNIETMLHRIEQRQDYREVLLRSIHGSAIYADTQGLLVIEDAIRLRRIDPMATTPTALLFISVRIEGSGNFLDTEVIEETILYNIGLTRIGIESTPTNPMISYFIGTDVVSRSARVDSTRTDPRQITDGVLDVITPISGQPVETMVVTSDTHEPKVYRIRRAALTDVLAKLTPADLFTDTLPTGHAMGVEYDDTENRLIVTFMNSSAIDYSLEQFYELTKLMHNTHAYRELLLRNNINRLVEFGSDNVKIRHDNLLYFRVLNDIGVNLNFFMEAGYTPTLSGGMYTAPIINRLSFSVTVPEIDNMRVSKMVVSNCVIQIFTEPTDTFSNFVTGGEETNVYVFGDNIYPLGTAFGEADETDITLNPIELPVFYTSTDLAYIDSLVNANEVAFIYDEDTTEFIIRFSPLQDLLLRIGQVHALIARAMQTDAFIRAVTFNDDVGLIVQQNTSFMFLSDSKVLFTLDTSTNPLISVTLDMNVISDYTVNPLIDGRQINLRAIEGGGTCATTAQLNQLEERLTEVINTDRDSIIKLL